MRVKIKKFLGILIILPILVGLFCGVVEADAAEDCKTKEDCEIALAYAQSDYNDIVALHEAFLDCWEECDDVDGWGEDEWEYCTTDKRGKKDDQGKKIEEECDAIYDEAYNLSGYLIELEDINEELTKKRKEMGNYIIALKVYLHSFEDVNVKSILAIEDQKIFSDAKYFLGKVIDLLIKMVGVVALVFLVIGGFRLVVAAGNDNEIQKAKSMIQYAVVGLIVALLAYIIVVAVQGILYR